MAEKQMGINDDEWAKKIAEGLGSSEPLTFPDSIAAIMKDNQKGIEKIMGITAPMPEIIPGTESPTKLKAEIEKMLPGTVINHTPGNTNSADSSYLNNPVMYEHAMRVANAFSKAKLLPELYQGDVASCFVALHMAERMQVDPLTFMQNSYVIKGKPAIEGKLMIAVLNARGGYVDGIEYEYTGKGDDYGCRAFGTLHNGKVHEARVDIKLAKAEGWYEKNSKWKNMPDQMLAYRSAAFLLRKYRPELLMGLQTYEEVQDVEGVVVESPVGKYRRSDLNDSLDVG